MELVGLAGVLASLLGLALTVYGVFFNGRATRSLIRETQAQIQAGHRDTQVLLEAIRGDIQAVQHNGQRRHDDLVSYLQDGQRRHDDLVAHLREMDRRHTELLAAIATSSARSSSPPHP